MQFPFTVAILWGVDKPTLTLQQATRAKGSYWTGCPLSASNRSTARRVASALTWL